MSEVHQVTLIERDRNVLPEGELPDVAGVIGDAADPGVLAEAGMRDADLLIAVTGEDSVNLLISLLAKRRFGVDYTVTRMLDAAHEWMFTPEMGVDVTVSTAVLVTRLVQEEVTAGDLVTLLRLHGTGIAVTETTLPPGAAVAGLEVSQLELPGGVALTAIVREGQVLLPERGGRLVAGDVVVALCEPGREHALHNALTGSS